MFEPIKIGGEREHDGGYLAVIAFVCAFGATAIGFLIGNRWVLPGLAALTVYPFYVELILRGQRRRAVVLGLVWAVFLSQATIIGTYAFPARAGKVIMKSAEYKAEMFSWVKTGQGKESSPKKFIGEHVREFAIFAALAIVTGGLGALFLGAMLLNYMNYYVGMLLAASAHPLWTLFVAWQPYAIIRVIGYVMVATALTETFYGVATRHHAKWRRVRFVGVMGTAFVALDIIVKALAAPAWGRIIKAAAGF
jgi:hypothetical protein